MARPLSLRLNPFQWYKGGSGSGGSGAGGGGGGEEVSSANTTLKKGHDERELSTAAEKEDAIVQATGMSAAEATLARKSIQIYTDEYYDAIRQSQKDGAPNVAAKSIENFISKSPKYQGTLHRGLNFKDKAAYDGFLRAHTPGNTITTRQIDSWSSSNRVASDFASGRGPSVVMIVRRNRSGASVKHLSIHREENEIVTPSNTSLRVDRRVTKTVRDEDGNKTRRTFVYLTDVS